MQRLSGTQTFRLKSMEELYEKVAARYIPSLSYIKWAQVINAPTLNVIKDPISISMLGKFDVVGSHHLATELRHVSITETLLCMSQLLLVLVGYLLERSYVSEWGPYDFTNYFGTSTENRSENLFVVGLNSKFNRQIPCGHGLEGKLTVIKSSRTKCNNYYFEVLFDFENSSHVCETQCIMLLEQKIIKRGNNESNHELHKP